jgi:hypothetical protein
MLHFLLYADLETCFCEEGCAVGGVDALGIDCVAVYYFGLEMLREKGLVIRIRD